MARFLAGVLFCMSACASSSSICDYDLVADGWVRTPSYPSVLDSENTENTNWFENSNGDYLSCASMKSDRVCKANYELHKKLPDGEYETDIVVCMM